MAIEVSIVPFAFKYLPMLKELYDSQKAPYEGALSQRILPKIGYIALLGGQPIAAGFLRRLEPCYAQIDTLVSNGYFGSQIRHAGVTKVVEALIDEAKHLKLEGLVCHTSDDGILKRAKELDFHVVEQKIIALALT